MRVVDGQAGAVLLGVGEHARDRVWKVEGEDPQASVLFHDGAQVTRRAIAQTQAVPLGAGWRFGHCPGEENVADFEVQLSGTPETGWFQTDCGRPQPDPGQLLEDYGLIVRGPHPLHPHRMATVLAGPHSLGTSAACLAATNFLLTPDVVSNRANTLKKETALNKQNCILW